jgi:hypothetical protein
MFMLMTRLKNSLTSPKDPVDGSFFEVDQNGRSSYLLLESLIGVIETDIYDYQCVVPGVYGDLDHSLSESSS